MSRPRQALWRIVDRLFPGRLSPKRWLSSGQQKQLRTQILPAIRSAAERRFADALRTQRLDLFDRIIGTHGRPGINLAAVVLPIDGSKERLQLAKHEPRLQGLFVEQLVRPEPKSAAFFANKIQSEEFVNFVRVLFPRISNWPQTVEDLRLEQDTSIVASKLTALGIISEHPSGLLSMAATPEHGAVELPDDLYKRIVCKTIGLTKDHFVRQLVEDDWLYNTVFWQTADAYDRGLLAPEHAPVFLKQYLDALGT